MIVQEQGDQLLLIRQTDHAILSGFFARLWGNDLFTRPEPFDSFCLAAAEHDNGWKETELLPEIDPRTRAPFSFTSLPTPQHMALYQQGIERVVKADHYAGLLVSLHCSGLYDRTRATLPGFSAKYIKADEMQLVSDFVQRLRLQQLRLKVDLRSSPATKEFAAEPVIEANLKRLEALDRLSLHFCLTPADGATIDAVPQDNDGNEVDWELHPEENNLVSLAPYAFRKDPLDFSILARRVPKRVYIDDLDFQKTLAAAPYFPIKFTLSGGRANAMARAARL